jgi:DNA-binding NarL/FixJ family response regulator
MEPGRSRYPIDCEDSMRVALADDSALFRRGLAMLLETVGVDITGAVSTGADLIRLVDEDKPDVVILDIRMPPTFTDEGLATAEQLRHRHGDLGVLMLSTYAETPYATRLLSGGSRGVGYLLKDRVDDAQTLRDALSRIVRGDCVMDPEIVARLLAKQRTTSLLDKLSARERDVLRLMAEGRSNLAIGQTLFLSAKTVETYVAGVFTKLGLPMAADDNRRVLAVLTWLRAASP